MVKRPTLGRCLLKRDGKTNGPHSNRHSSSTNEDFSRLPVRSVTEENTLTEFFSIAELANSDFTAQKKSFRFVTKGETLGLPSSTLRQQSDELHKVYQNLLKIPRRPRWTQEMTPEQLNQLEKEEMLTWRRSLANLEQTKGVVLTPFEKNIEFWRQLWRVVERSDILVQLVDARQPLLYYCSDLEVYAHEVDPNKVCIVLVNKADFLTPEQRELWSVYFREREICAIFWSATAAVSSRETYSLNNLDSVSGSQPTESDYETDNASFNSDGSCSTPKASSDSEEDPVRPTSSSTVNHSAPDATAAAAETSAPGFQPDGRLLNSTELLDLFSKQLYPSNRPIRGSQLTVGFVGYPNVGKSSTLNALIGQKKTAVSATPGRTKHFQTLCVRPNLMLCDCPGLVMPSFVHSKADLVVAGILSIDEMRDCLSPVGLVCERIPQSVLELKYGIKLSKPILDTRPQGGAEDSPPTPHELLAAHAISHSFMTAKGNPHYDRSARIILKDYVQGRLLYCHPPPGTDPQAFQLLGRNPDSLPPSLAHANMNEKTVAQRGSRRKSQSDAPSSLITDFDKMIFSKQAAPKSHFRTRKVLPVRPSSDTSAPDVGAADGDDTLSTSSWTTVDSSVGGSTLLSGVELATCPSLAGTKKPWRVVSQSKRLDPFDSAEPSHHCHGKRREKLRRVYANLDQHPVT